MLESEPHLDAGLKACEKVRKRARFLLIQGSGRKFASAHFLAFYVLTDLNCSRIGLTVSKRVGGAVTRNRVKRLLREAYRHQKHLLPGGCDLVIVAKTNAAGVDYGQTCVEFREIASRIHKGHRPTKT